MSAKKPATLTGKQERFVQEYLIDRNATRAAVRAGYGERSARQEGYRLLHDARYRHVQEAVRQAIRELREAHEHLRDRIIQERCRIAFSDVREFYERCEDGELRLKPVDELVGDEAAAILEIKEVQFEGKDGAPGVSRKLKLHPKNEALAALEKILGLTKDRVEHSGALDIRGAREELSSILAGLGPTEGVQGGAGGEGPGAEAASPGEPDGPAGT